jgi:RHS repeat-associated protein
MGFTGKPFDHDTKLQNNINRWYEAGTGKWLSEDPIGYKGGINLYEYCGNKPTDRTDPSGLQYNTIAGPSGSYGISGSPAPIRPPCNCPPTKAECDFEIEAHERLFMMQWSDATNGINDSLFDMSEKYKSIANAGGYRAEKLKKKPCWFQRAMNEFERDWWQFSKANLLWGGDLLIQTLKPSRLYDTGYGDIWLMMEMTRTKDFIKRLKTVCEDAK